MREDAAWWLFKRANGADAMVSGYPEALVRRHWRSAGRAIVSGVFCLVRG